MQACACVRGAASEGEMGCGIRGIQALEFAAREAAEVRKTQAKQKQNNSKTTAKRKANESKVQEEK